MWAVSWGVSLRQTRARAKTKTRPRPRPRSRLKTQDSRLKTQDSRRPGEIPPSSALSTGTGQEIETAAVRYHLISSRKRKAQTLIPRCTEQTASVVSEEGHGVHEQNRGECKTSRMLMTSRDRSKNNRQRMRQFMHSFVAER